MGARLLHITAAPASDLWAGGGARSSDHGSSSPGFKLDTRSRWLQPSGRVLVWKRDRVTST